MLSTIETVNNVVNNFIWGVPAMICIIGVGLYLSIRMRFLQIRKFPYSMKVTLGIIGKKKETIACPPKRGDRCWSLFLLHKPGKRHHACIKFKFPVTAG